MTTAVRQPHSQFVFENCFYPGRALQYASHGLEEPQRSKLIPKPQERCFKPWSSCTHPSSTTAVTWQWRSSQMIEMAQYPKLPVQFVERFSFFRRGKSSRRFASVVIPVRFCHPPEPTPVIRAMGGCGTAKISVSKRSGDTWGPLAFFLPMLGVRRTTTRAGFKYWASYLFVDLLFLAL